MPQKAEQFFEEALDNHHASPWLFFFLAQYLRAHRHNVHLELLHIHAADVRAMKGVALEPWTR